MKIKVAVFHHEIQDENGQKIRDRSIVLEYKLGPSFVFEICNTKTSYEINSTVTNSKLHENGTSIYRTRSEGFTGIDKTLREIVDQEFTTTALTYSDRTSSEYKALMREWNDARHRIIGDAAEGFYPKPNKQWLKNPEEE